MLERAGRFSQYRVQWPEWNAAFVAGILRWLTLAVFLTGLAWWVAQLLKRRSANRDSGVPTASR